jgi:hypothetical protein
VGNGFNRRSESHLQVNRYSKRYYADCGAVAIRQSLEIRFTCVELIV